MAGVCVLAAALIAVSPKAATDIAQKPELTLYVGNVRNLNPGDIRGKKTWTSSKEKVVSVAERGIVTAKKKGTATIKVTDGKKTLSCKITVLPVQMKKDAVTTKVGKTVSLKLYCGTKKGITWESSDPEVLAYASDTGNRAKWTALKAGTATVTATIYGKSYTTVVTVEEKAVPTQEPTPTPTVEPTPVPTEEPTPTPERTPEQEDTLMPEV